MGQHPVRQRGPYWNWEIPVRRGYPHRRPGHAAPLADLAADLRVERAQRVDDGVDGARAGLEDRGRVEGDPLEAHLLELDDARDHAVVLDVEALAGGIARR